MRSQFLVLCVLALFGFAIASWSKEDYEIFKIRDELELAEGEGVTFYDFLQVPQGPRATLDEISKAFRKTSVKSHPDKLRLPKGLTARQIAEHKRKASERFARLGVVAGILKGPQRERYDHFLRNGFPKWRGTGYYYQRYRPGLVSVLVGLWLFAGVAHFGLLKLQARQHRAHVRRLRREAVSAAWGEDRGVFDVPEEKPVAAGEDQEAEFIPRNRKERRAALKAAEKKGVEAPPVKMVAAHEERNAGQRRKVVKMHNGRTFAVDAANNVWLVDGAEEVLLEEAMVEDASWGNTLLVRAPRAVWRLTVGRFVGGKAQEEEVAEDGEEVEEAEDDVKKVPKKVEATVGGARRRAKARK